LELHFSSPFTKPRFELTKTGFEFFSHSVSTRLDGSESQTRL